MQQLVTKYQGRSHRITASQSMPLSPTEPRGEFFEEITKTINVSREGFYFVTRRDHCQEGMRLLVTLPYHCPRDHSDREHLAQVVRIELLDDRQHGVAVQLLSSVRLQTVAPCSPGGGMLL